MILLSRRKHHAIIRNGLVGLWLSGPESGADASGYGRDGTISGSPSWIESAKGRAINFDAVDDKIASIGAVADFSFINNGSPFSIAFESSFYANNARYTIIGNTLSGAERGFFILREYLTGYGLNVMRIHVVDGVNVVAAGTTNDNTAPSGELARWCYTFDRSVDNIGQWYKNGIAITTTTRWASGDGLSYVGSVTQGNASRTLSIGVATWSSFILGMKGKLADVRIYNRALTAAEAIAITSGVG